MASRGKQIPSKATFDDGDEPWRCRAKSKTQSREAGEPVRCGNHKEPGYNVCRYHGARGGAPIKTGRYSIRLGRFRDAYESALNEEEALMDLRETMALLDITLQRAAERAAQLDTPDFRKRANQIFDLARQATDPEEARRHLSDLGMLLREGSDEDSALKQLSDAAERLAQRQEKAWSIRLSAAQVINARDLVTVLSRFVEIVTEEAPEIAPRIIERVDREIVGGGEVSPRLSSGQ